MRGNVEIILIIVDNFNWKLGTLQSGKSIFHKNDLALWYFNEIGSFRSRDQQRKCFTARSRHSNQWRARHSIGNVERNPLRTLPASGLQLFLLPVLWRYHFWFWAVATFDLVVFLLTVLNCFYFYFKVVTPIVTIVFWFVSTSGHDLLAHSIFWCCQFRYWTCCSIRFEAV